MPYTFQAHVIIQGQITCLTGLHIGGTEEKYEIGGMDNPIIKDKITGYPYIPGSSIKGKMRSAMEWERNKIESMPKKEGNVHGESCKTPTCEICRIFGRSAAQQQGKVLESPGPTRLLVRDAHLSQTTIDNPNYVKDKVFRTEVKTENNLNRITSKAMPRPMERVPQGAQFNLEIVYGVYDMNDGGNTDIDYLAHVITALQLLEAGVLGGGGSRGSGKIALKDVKVTIKTVTDYQQATSGTPMAGVTLKEMLENAQTRLRQKQEGQAQ